MQFEVKQGVGPKSVLIGKSWRYREINRAGSQLSAAGDESEDKLAPTSRIIQGPILTMHLDGMDTVVGLLREKAANAFCQTARQLKDLGSSFDWGHHHRTPCVDNRQRYHKKILRLDTHHSSRCVDKLIRLLRFTRNTVNDTTNAF
jgi:hypothetical protein